MINNLIDFYLKSHPVTLGVLALLSVYFIVLNWVFFYRFFSINSWLKIENNSLVVSILDTFTHIGQSSGSMSVISSGVSDALVATAAGIFVAIFAYTYHQILKRKSFELVSFLQMQSDAVLARKA
jgi:MotA/TolQ/ExbB proton channel family protein